MSKKTLIAIILAVLVLPLQAQSLKEAIHENAGRAAANHHPYEYGTAADTPAPDGYTPFYISHFARHGSRFDDSMHSIDRLMKELHAADSAQLLTAKGKELVAAEMNFRKQQEGYEGMLTKVGYAEHAGMAVRMYDKYTPVFKQSDRKEVHAISTFVPRTIMSMTAFTKKLDSKNRSLVISLSSGDLCQSELSAHGVMEHAMKLFNAAKDSLDNHCGHKRLYKTLFTDVKKAEAVMSVSPETFMHYLFCTTDFSECVPVPELDPKKWFTEDEIVQEAKYQNAKSYYYTRQAYLKDGRTSSADLLDLIVSDADKAVEGGSVAADLRFGHDTQIGVLLSLMGVGEMPITWPAAKIADHWCSGTELCMGTNMQLIFYKNANGDVLVKVLHNERERQIPDLTPVTGPYYKWSDVRAYWKERTSGKVPVEKWGK